MEFIQKNKMLIAAVAVLIAGIAIFVVMGGNSGPSNASGNAKIDSSKAVTTSQDKLDNGAVKMGNIGSVGGNLDLSRHNTKQEGN